MVVITLFTDTVKCCSCHEPDMYNGLKKKNDRWYCKQCLGNSWNTIRNSYAPGEIPSSDDTNNS